MRDGVALNMHLVEPTQRAIANAVMAKAGVLNLHILYRSETAALVVTIIKLLPQAAT